jgi:hypothetical protein
LLLILMLVPAMAGVSGALLRSSVDYLQGREDQKTPPLGRTTALGAIAGGIAGLLFVSAQLVTVPAEVAVDIWLKQTGRLVPFALLVGVIAGLTPELIFGKLTRLDVLRSEILERLPPPPTSRSLSRPNRLKSSRLYRPRLFLTDRHYLHGGRAESRTSVRTSHGRYYRTVHPLFCKRRLMGTLRAG